MIRYYISGQMRGLPENNHPTFHSVEKALSGMLLKTASEGGGFEIINPARNFGGDISRPRSDYMQLDIGHVLNSDVVVLLPGWERSPGAELEVYVAVSTGKRFLLAQEDQLLGWVFESIETPTPKPSPRAAALEEARQLITGDRNNQYGPPTQDFRRSADALNAFEYRGPGGRALRPHDIAIFVMTIKMSRLMWSPEKRDHWVDVAGYAGCGYECAVEEENDCSH